MEEQTVGGWTQAYCTTCRTMREHIIVAMVGTTPAKVECTSCHKQHRYRAAAPGTKAEKPAKAPRAAKSSARGRGESASPAAEPVRTINLEEKIQGREALAYDPKHRFSVDDVVEHPSFGLGLVLALPGPQKVEVLFTSGAKLLLHDRGAPKAGLVRPQPRDDDSGPRVSDAPPKR